MAHIRKRGKTYQIIVSNGRDAAGKQLIETKTFTPDPSWSEKRTQKELLKAADEFEAQVKTGLFFKGSQMTFEELADKWMTEYVVPTLMDNTRTKYAEVVRAYLVPKFGKIKLENLTPLLIQSFFNEFYSDTSRYNLSHGSVQKILTVMKSIMKKAYQWSLIKENPMDRIYLPKSSVIDKKPACFTQEQAIAFLKFIDAPYSVLVSGHSYHSAASGNREISAYSRSAELSLQLKLFFIIALYGGLRKGEALGLRWEDIDYQKNELYIKRSAYSYQGEMKTKVPKTKGSARVLSMPASVMELFAKHQQAQQAQCLELSGYWNDEGWVFTQDNGKMMNYSTPYHAFKRVIAHYNQLHTNPEDHLPDIPLHGLRHTTATLLITNNVDPVTVAARLGHSQTSTTLDTYSHAVQSTNKAAAIQLEQILTPK